ncbi:MAG: glutamine synthetase family protein [Parvibaculaceae bacterium]
MTECSGNRQIAICVPDNCGRLIGKRQPAARLAEARASGMAMPNFHLVTGLENKPYSTFAVAGAHTGFRNGALRPDLESLFKVPGESDIDYYIADAYDGAAAEVPQAPRSILKRQLVRLAEAGLAASMASELEFYLFERSFAALAETDYRDLRPFYHRHGDNDLFVTSIVDPFLRQIEEDLTAAGLSVDQIQGEGGIGQLEINVRPSHPLKACDHHAIFKHVVRMRAFLAGKSVTFMAKPFDESAGSGAHIHLCLKGADDRPLLVEGQQPRGVAASFIAGILAHAGDFTFLHAPYANSYRRLRKGNFTPLNASWAWDNRTCLVRLTGTGKSARFEFRLPGADANPYFAYAGLIAAGLAGIEGGLALPSPVTGDAGGVDLPPLPRDLTEALAAFRDSPVARDAFGPDVHHHLTALGEEELDIERLHVTDWDRRRGFEAA